MIVESGSLGYLCDTDTATVKCHVADQCLAQVFGDERRSPDLIGLVSVCVCGGGGGLIGWQGPRSCRARNRETQSKDPWLRFRQITPFQTQQVLCQPSIYAKVSEKR